MRRPRRRCLKRRVQQVSCSAIKEALAPFADCEATPNGARILTHCLYPSFQPVAVYVVGFGKGFIVHDGGDAQAVCWAHGRDERATTRYFNEQATKHGLRYVDGNLKLVIEDPTWLASAILAVANAASGAANASVEHIARSAMVVLQDAIHQALIGRFAKSNVLVHPTRTGGSGRSYDFDFGVIDSGRMVLIDAVTPYAASINSKYTAFSDVMQTLDGIGFAVFDRPLQAPEKTLLSQVAQVVPLASMTRGVERELPNV